MKNNQTVIDKDMILFKGSITSNILFKIHVCNSYILKTNNELIIIDPACGRKRRKELIYYIKNYQKSNPGLKKLHIIATHTHFDHANNFGLCDAVNLEQKVISIHEKAFNNNVIMNKPADYFKREIVLAKKYYSSFKAFFFPYNILLLPLNLLNFIFPALSVTILSHIAGIRTPNPVNGRIQPSPLKESELKYVQLGTLNIKCWRSGELVLIPAPGHTPCMISIYHPGKKALFVGDADWIGNPTLIASSVKDCLHTLRLLKTLTSEGNVEILLSGHGDIKRGSEIIIKHFDYHINRIETLKNEILAAYGKYGTKNILQLVKNLVKDSPLFRLLKKNHFPNNVIIIHNMVVAVLKEAGIFDADSS